ncbi:MAG: T9SS type A sorting domain-containing protein [Candidatus Krumholzibacteriia bacterium]
MSLLRSLGALFLLTLFSVPAFAADAVIIPCLSGFLRDAAGGPVVGGDLDFFQAATGAKLITPGDNTDLFGFYNVCVLPGIYDVTYAPPPGTRLVGKRFTGIDLTGNVGKEMDVTLNFGVVVGGTVTDLASGAPIGGVDLDFDRVSGPRIYTPNDNSAPLTGVYRAVVPAGQFRVRFDPPVGTRWRGLQLDSVTVAADTIIDVALTQGVLLSGRVTDDVGQGLQGINVDLRTIGTGEKIFVSQNKTDVNGDYLVAVPTGLFELQLSPPPGSHLVGALVDSFSITADLRWDQQLKRGVVVTVVAEDSLADPVPGVDLDLRLESTGEKVFTPNDKTNLHGTAAVSVLPGVYTLILDPPPATTFDRLVVPGLSLFADASFVFELPQVPRVRVTGRVTDPSGLGLVGIEIEAGREPTGSPVFIPNNATDTAGVFDIGIPTGVYDVFVSPPRGSRFVALRIDNVPVTQDTVWDDVALQPGVLFSATTTDRAGAPIRDVDFDFFPAGTGLKALTPHDNTDARGTVDVTLRPDTYTIVITAPAGSAMAPLTLNGVSVRADTTADFTLKAPVITSFLRPNYPNPFSGATTIPYDVGASGQASVKVYNVLGQLVAVLENGFHGADTYSTTWNGTDRTGQRVASGVYFCRLATPQGTTSRRMVFLH